MIGYPNLTYLLIGQNFVNIMITELSERRIDLHPEPNAITHIHDLLTAAHQNFSHKSYIIATGIVKILNLYELYICKYIIYIILRILCKQITSKSI